MSTRTTTFLAVCVCFGSKLDKHKVFVPFCLVSLSPVYSFQGLACMARRQQSRIEPYLVVASCLVKLLGPGTGPKKDVPCASWKKAFSSTQMETWPSRKRNTQCSRPLGHPLAPFFLLVLNKTLNCSNSVIHFITCTYACTQVTLPT